MGGRQTSFAKLLPSQTSEPPAARIAYPVVSVTSVSPAACAMYEMPALPALRSFPLSSFVRGTLVATCLIPCVPTNQTTRSLMVVLLGRLRWLQRAFVPQRTRSPCCSQRP